jgi:hypothetical protein
MNSLTFEFARLPVGNDEVDGQCEVEFDGPSGGWQITGISALDGDGKLIDLHPLYNSFRHVRNCLYAYRGDEIADAIREVMQ